MAISLSTLINIVRSRYNSADQDPFFSDEYIRYLVWEAESVLAKEGWVIEDTVTTVSVDGTRTYTFPENTIAIKEIRYDNKLLAPVEMKFDPKTDATEPEGTPRQYGIWDDVIYLFPTPDTSADVIAVKRFVYPSVLSSNISPLNVPTEYQVDVANFILANMAAKDQNLALSAFYMSMWQATVEKAKQQRKKRLRKDRITRVKDYYFGSDDFTFGDYGIPYGASIS